MIITATNGARSPDPGAATVTSSQSPGTLRSLPLQQVLQQGDDVFKTAALTGSRWWELEQQGQQSLLQREHGYVELCQLGLGESCLLDAQQNGTAEDASCGDAHQVVPVHQWLSTPQVVDSQRLETVQGQGSD